MGNSNYFFNAYKRNEIKSAKKDEGSNNPSVKPFIFERVVLKNETQKTEEKKSETVTVITKIRATAVFLILSGIENAAKILKSFTKDELEKITKEILVIGSISQEEARVANEKFGIQIPSDLENYYGGKEFVRMLYLKLYGLTDGSEAFVKIVEEKQRESTEYIDKLEPGQIKEILISESDMVFSKVLSFLSPAKAAGVIKILLPERAANIIKQMSYKSQMNEDFVKIIITKINEKAKELLLNEGFVVQGKKRLLDIIRSTDQNNAEKIIFSIEQDNPELAKELRENIFTFNDILKLEKKDLEVVLKEYDNKEIAYILKGTSPEIRTVFLTCVTNRRKDIIENEIELLGSVRKSDIEDKRKQLLSYIKTLDMDGKIIINREKEKFVE